jgi:hypothetical protein
LTVPDLGTTAAELKKRGIAFKSAKHELTVTDPDGNLPVFTAPQDRSPDRLRHTHRSHALSRSGTSITFRMPEAWMRLSGTSP